MGKMKHLAQRLWRIFVSTEVSKVALPSPFMLLFNFMLVIGVYTLVLYINANADLSLTFSGIPITVPKALFAPRCVSSEANGLGWSVILVVFLHLIWRAYRHIIPPDTLPKAEGDENWTKKSRKFLTMLLDKFLHPWVLTDQGLIFLGIALGGAAWILGISSFSPFLAGNEPTPVIEEFSVRYAGQDLQLKPSSMIEVSDAIAVTVNAKLSRASGATCVWSTLAGSLPSGDNCSTVYFLPFGKGGDTLIVHVESMCRTGEAYEKLFIVRKR